MDSVQRSLSRPGLKDVGVVGERTGNSCENRGAWGFSGQTTELAEDFYGLGSVVQVCSEGLLSPMLSFIERAISRAASAELTTGCTRATSLRAFSAIARTLSTRVPTTSRKSAGPDLHRGRQSPSRSFKCRPTESIQ
jgi:hypothetical protein